MIPIKVEKRRGELRGMMDYVAFSTHCATCHFWSGERRPEWEEGRIYTPRHATIGSCECPHGHWRGRLKPGESNCPHWARWAAMLDAPDARFVKPKNSTPGEG